MSDEMKRLESALRDDITLVEKFEAEYRRISGSKNISMENAAYLEAAKNLGFNITRTDIDKFMAEQQELTPEEMDSIAGGGEEDPWCITVYNCYTAFLHAEHTEVYDACWKDYDCVQIYHDGGLMQKQGCKATNVSPQKRN